MESRKTKTTELIRLQGPPDIIIRFRPRCGKDLEMFSVDTRPYVCGANGFDDMRNCLNFCSHAKECIGEEVYVQHLTDQPA